MITIIVVVPVVILKPKASKKTKPKKKAVDLSLNAKPENSTKISMLLAIIVDPNILTY